MNLVASKLETQRQPRAHPGLWGSAAPAPQLLPVATPKQCRVSTARPHPREAGLALRLLPKARPRAEIQSLTRSLYAVWRGRCNQKVLARTADQQRARPE